MDNNTLKVRCCNTGKTLLVEKKLMIHRHKNGQISRIGTYVSMKDYYHNTWDLYARERPYCVGPEIFFDRKGRIDAIYVWGIPQSQSPITHLGQCIWYSPVLWAKYFYATGKIKKTIGEQGKFTPSLTMITALKRENLWNTVKQAVATQPLEQSPHPLIPSQEISGRAR